MAAKSSDMKNPKHRQSEKPGKLKVTAPMPIIQVLPRVANLPKPKQAPPNVKAQSLSPTRPKTKSPTRRLQAAKAAPRPKPETTTPGALPRVATLSTQPWPRTPTESLPPRITAPPIIQPRSQTPNIGNSFPRVLSPRDGPRCPTAYNPELHGSKGPCERCMFLASEEEKGLFHATGHHLRIMVVTGGCDRSCLLFPRDEGQTAVRLCKKCYFDTHRTVYDAVHLP